MLLIQRVCEGSQDLSSWFCTNPPSQGWDMLPKPPQCPGTAVTQLMVAFPWAWIQPRVRDPDVTIRDKTSFPKGIWPHLGEFPSFRKWNNHPESGTTRSTWWHLCDPEGPWQGGKPAEDRQFLREGWFGVFPLHFLAQEGKAHCRACSHISHIKALSEPLSSELPKGKGENQNQQTEEQLELHLS